MQALLDARTLTIVALMVALVPALISALVWQSRWTYPGRWVLGNALAAATLLLLSLRGTAPDWMSIVVANASAVGVGILFLQGLRQFRGLRIRWWPECLLGALAVGVVTWFRYVTNDINVRILAMSIALGCVGIACGITVLKQMPPGRKVGVVITGLVFVLTGAVHLLRGIYTFAIAPVTDLFDPSIANAVFFLGASLAVLGWSFGFIVLTAERLEVPNRAGQERESVREQLSATELPSGNVPDGEVRLQLRRIVASNIFRRSAQMERFLTLIVDRTLLGRPEELKEYALGRDVFHRGKDYDPRTDSIVRVEAQRLRRKLREYYESQGDRDAVVIKLPPGSYVPVFEFRQHSIAPPRPVVLP